MNMQYLPQYKRVKRFFNLIQDIQRQGIDDSNFEYAVDMTLSFFMHCYHVYDWLIASDISKEKILDFINNSHSLKICRDLCVNAKHFEISKSQPLAEIANFNKFGNSSIQRSYDPIEDKSFLVIPEGGLELDVVNLADNCIKEWDKFIDSHKTQG